MAFSFANSLNSKTKKPKRRTKTREEAYFMPMREVMANHAMIALKQAGGNKSKASDMLGISKHSLTAILAEVEARNQAQEARIAELSQVHGIGKSRMPGNGPRLVQDERKDDPQSGEGSMVKIEPVANQAGFRETWQRWRRERRKPEPDALRAAAYLLDLVRTVHPAAGTYHGTREQAADAWSWVLRQLHRQYAAGWSEIHAMSEKAVRDPQWRPIINSAYALKKHWPQLSDPAGYRAAKMAGICSCGRKRAVVNENTETDIENTEGDDE